MSNGFLHGIETVTINNGIVPVKVVKSAVIALIGTAPLGAKNTPVLVQSPQDGAQFGDQLPGFTIPKALDAIFKQGAGTVIVVNVFDPVNDVVQITDEPHEVENGAFKLVYPPIGAVTLELDASPDTVIDPSDYEIDSFGNVTILDSTAVPEGSAVLATYKRFDPSLVANSQIIGTYDSLTDTRTGLKCYDLSFQMFGFTPKIFIAPGFSSITAIATELIATADQVKFRGRAVIDAPAGTTIAVAVAGRGPLGTINFQSANKRAVYLYPMVKAFDAYSEADENRPYSAYFAGVWAATISNDGYWFSPSNREIKGITGVEFPISAAVNDASTDANLLNENGIITIFNNFGSGLRTWGNRNAAFPGSSDPITFNSVLMVKDILEESVELSMMPFLDVPITPGVIDSVRESVNSFIRQLIQRGAIIDGECTYDPNDNPPTELALGHINYRLTFMPPTPAERITFQSFIDISLLQALNVQ